MSATVRPNRFDYVKYDEKAADDQSEFKERCQKLESLINTLVDSRYKSLALTALEEAYCWIGKAIRDEQIARNGLAGLQEERCDS